jgi:hypothetical protein
MAADQTVSPYVFVVDTNKYSGNFEREMCAFMTGALGECGVGGEELVMFEENGQFPNLSDKTHCVPDENGCVRPATIWPTPGRWNNGNGEHFNGEVTGPGRCPAYESVAVFFNERPTDEEIAFMKQRAYAFVAVQLADQQRFDKKAKPMKIKGFRLIAQTVTTQEQSV